MSSLCRLSAWITAASRSPPFAMKIPVSALTSGPTACAKSRALLPATAASTMHGGRDLPGAEDLDYTIPRDRVPKNLHYVCMTQYDKKFTLPVVIPPESMDNILANVMGQMNMRNLRVAETEKYAHVTYFFNGGVEQPFPGEDRVAGSVAKSRNL